MSDHLDEKRKQEDVPREHESTTSSRPSTNDWIFLNIRRNDPENPTEPLETSSSTDQNINTLLLNLTPKPSIGNCSIDDEKLTIYANKSQISIVTNVSVTNNTPNHKKTSISSSSSCLCRICQNNTFRERLISPCNCKGSLAYVHLSCLERWLNQSSRTYCELCLFQFNSVLSQRYSLCESLRLWVRHPRNRNNLQSDILISCLLTIVTGGLVAVCLLGMQYFVLEGNKLGISRAWTKGAISCFLSIVLVGYLITLYLLVKDQFLPWYRWWRQTVNVRLILTPTSVETNTNTDIGYL